MHLALEERISRFMGAEAATLYSYDLVTAASAIHAVAGPKDVIVCDEVSYQEHSACFPRVHVAVVFVVSHHVQHSQGHRAVACAIIC